MGFAWSAMSIGTKATAAIFTEVKDNCDTTATTLGVATYAWAENYTVGEKIKTSVAQELRDAIDYLDDSNVCSHNATHDSTHNGTNNSADNGANDSSVEATHDSTDNTTQYTGDNDSHNSGDNGTDNTGDYSSENTGHQATAFSGDNGVEYSTYQSGHDGTYNAFNNVTV